MSSLFSSESQNIIYTNQAKNYTGSPLVFIEGISDKPQPKDWMDEMKIKLFGSMELPKQAVQKPLPPLEQKNIQQGVQIHSLFQGEKTVAFLPHTADWNFIIQILNDKEIVIQEDILFIKTKETPPLMRDWPQQKMDLLEVHINGRPVAVQLQEEKNMLKWQLPDLQTGVHRIRLVYLLKGKGLFSKNEARISFPLTGIGWHLATDSLTGVVLFPKNIKESNATFLFGKNNKQIPKAFEVAKDSSGALFFRSTHLIPADALIQMDLGLKFDSFVRKRTWDELSESPSFLIFLISLGVILGYLILNVIEIKVAPVSDSFSKSQSASSNSLKAFWNRTKEIWTGLILLWMGTFITAIIMKTSLTLLENQFLFLIPIAFVLIMDYVLLYPRQQKRGVIK